MPGFRERLKKSTTLEELKNLNLHFYKLSEKAQRRCRKIYDERIKEFGEKK